MRMTPADRHLHIKQIVNMANCHFYIVRVSAVSEHLIQPAWSTVRALSLFSHLPPGLVLLWYYCDVHLLGTFAGIKLEASRQWVWEPAAVTSWWLYSSSGAFRHSLWQHGELHWSCLRGDIMVVWGFSQAMILTTRPETPVTQCLDETTREPGELRGLISAHLPVSFMAKFFAENLVRHCRWVKWYAWQSAYISPH